MACPPGAATGLWLCQHDIALARLCPLVCTATEATRAIHRTACKPHAWDYGQWIMGFRGQDYGIMRFGAQDYGIMRFRAKDYGFMRLALDFENVCGGWELTCIIHS
jgi:hypothetical protein